MMEWLGPGGATPPSIRLPIHLPSGPRTSQKQRWGPVPSKSAIVCPGWGLTRSIMVAPRVCTRPGQCRERLGVQTEVEWSHHGFCLLIADRCTARLTFQISTTSGSRETLPGAARPKAASPGRAKKVVWRRATACFGRRQMLRSARRRGSARSLGAADTRTRPENRAIRRFSSALTKSDPGGARQP
jgi:hypothetical protein